MAQHAMQLPNRTHLWSSHSPQCRRGNGMRIQEKLEQIPNRDLLSRAWVNACLHRKSVISLQWVNDETVMNDSNTAPPTPGTITPAAKRHQRDPGCLRDMSTTPTAPKPMRLEFTLPMPNNKRNNRPYKTPIKSTNDGKRATKTDDHTPVQIKAMKKVQKGQSIPEQPGIPRKSKEKMPKKASKSYIKKGTKEKRNPPTNEQKTVTNKKRKGKLTKKNKHIQAHKYSNKTKT